MSGKPRFLTAGDAARYCQVSLNTVKNWIGSGLLPAFKLPKGHYRIERDAFRRFLDAQEMPVDPEFFGEEPSRILVVDDEPAIVQFLQRALSHEGYDVETAMDGYEGLIRVGQFKPDLLLLDVRMPLIDGLEVTRRIKASADTKRIVVIGMTGQDDPEIGRSLVAAGARTCLKKPLVLADLLHVIEENLPGARRESNRPSLHPDFVSER